MKKGNGDVSGQLEERGLIMKQKEKGSEGSGKGNEEAECTITAVIHQKSSCSGAPPV